MNIQMGRDHTPETLCRALLELAGPDRQREVVWRYEDQSVDVPDDIGQAFLDAEAAKPTATPAKRSRRGKAPESDGEGQ